MTLKKATPSKNINLLLNKLIIIIKKTFDGCKADIVIKPLNSVEDLWLGIQVKTTHIKTARSQYYFRLNNSNYENIKIMAKIQRVK